MSLLRQRARLEPLRNDHSVVKRSRVRRLVCPNISRSTRRPESFTTSAISRRVRHLLLQAQAINRREKASPNLRTPLSLRLERTRTQHLLLLTPSMSALLCRRALESDLVNRWTKMINALSKHQKGKESSITLPKANPATPSL